MEVFRQFAESANSDGGLLAMLGIDWKLLIFQIVAFLVTLYVLGKLVYPWLLKSVDDRQAKIEATEKAAEKAETAAVDAEEKVAKLMNKARKEAGEMVETAKTESNALVAAAEEKSRERADQIIADAQEEIKKEVSAAKKALREQTVELVAMATEKVVGKVVDEKVDNKIINAAIKEAEK